ncbi:MAG: DUF2339 domain-containing protein [Verrucomicrobia bacterium]|nr:DUF2339 domain-containing protein [Verrucomicrobiota bacterium]
MGQKWFLGIGVFVLLLAAGFFLKYAFDEKWIGPATQVTLGFVFGALLFVAGEICRRRKLRGLDIALAAVGLGVLYLSVYAANQIYSLIPDPLTIFVILLVSAVGLSVAAVWDSRLLAVLAFLGGYLAPVLDTTGKFGHLLFFGCLTIINLASESLAFLKRWTQLYFLGALFSWVLLFIFWGSLESTSSIDAFGFIQFLFLLYSIAPFLRSFLRAGEDRIPLIWVAVINGWLCSWKSAELLHSARVPLSLLTLAYGCLALAVAIIVWRRGSTPARTWLLVQGMIYFLLAWSVIFSTRWITFCWAAQCVAGYWLAKEARDRILLRGTILLGLVTVFRFLILDLELVLGAFDQYQQTAPFTDGLLSRWVTGLSICFFLLTVAWLAFRAAKDPLQRTVFRCFEIMGLIAVFGFFNVELDRFTWQFLQRAQLSAYSVLWVFFAALLLVGGFIWNRRFYRITAIVLLFITVGKVLVCDTAEVAAPYRILSCAVVGGVLIGLSALYYRLAPRLLASTAPTLAKVEPAPQPPSEIEPTH